jgi:hypothetical protein
VAEIRSLVARYPQCDREITLALAVNVCAAGSLLVTAAFILGLTVRVP